MTHLSDLRPAPPSAARTVSLRATNTTEPPRNRIVEALRALPADADTVIALKDPSALLHTSRGRAVARMLTETDLIGDRTLEAWNRLAEAVNLPPDEAFERIFGRRLVLVSRRSPAPGDAAEFVLMGEIDRRDGLDLLTSLRVAPRDRIAGVIRFAGERGRFRLALVDGEAPRATLLLALDESLALFDDLVRGLAVGEDERLADTPAGDALARLDDPEVILLRRSFSPAQPDAPRPWRRFSLLGATGVDDGWRATVEILPTPRSGPGLPAWPRGVIDRLDDGAAVAILTTAPPAELDRLRSLFADIPWSDEQASFAELLTGRIALVVRAPREPDPPRGGSVSVAIESPHPDLLATAMDAYLARAVAAPADHAPVAGFRGAFPHAVRILRLEPARTGALVELVGGQPALTWARCPHARPDHEAGWFALGLSPPDPAWPIPRLCARLADPLPGAPPPVTISEGIIRPPELGRWVRLAGTISPAVADALIEPFTLAGVTEVRWTIRSAEDRPGLVGEISVRMEASGMGEAGGRLQEGDGPGAIR